MTYLQFHLLLILPPLLLLAALNGKWLTARRSRPAALSLAAIALIALLYTTPWDNYLVWKGVWSYGPHRVIGTLGYVPIEEYLFFLLQPLLTGLWFYHLLRRRPPHSSPPSRPAPTARRTGLLLSILLSALGIWLLQDAETLYLGLILAWAGPVLAAQWAYGGHWIWSLRRPGALAVALSTVYLWAADRVALAAGVWSISDTYTTGLHFLGLPLEEAVFFLVTNLLVVQGLALLLAGGQRFQSLPTSADRERRVGTAAAAGSSK